MYLVDSTTTYSVSSNVLKIWPLLLGRCTNIFLTPPSRSFLQPPAGEGCGFLFVPTQYVSEFTD